MKIRTFITGLVGVAAVAAGILYGRWPDIRSRVHEQWNASVGWSDSARRANPDGYVRYVTRRLENDLGQLQTTRRNLDGERGSLDGMIRELQAKREHAERLAGEFRDAYQRASTTGSFPVAVRGAAYTEEQAVNQVSLLLAEQESFRQAIERLQKTREQADSRLETLTVRIDATASELAALPAKREVLRADRLEAEGQQLAAAVDALFEENKVAIAGSPVRPVSELLAAEPAETPKRPDVAAARQFLAARSVVEFAETPAPSPSDVKVTPKQESKRTPKGKRSVSVAKPIFQQS